MEIKDECGSALLKRLSEKIDSANDHRHRFGNSFTASSLVDGLGGVHFCTRFLGLSCERIAFSHAWVEGRREHADFTMTLVFHVCDSTVSNATFRTITN
jgi:hypothetical protein